MSETPNLSLPLLAPAQAQKHVTVNEALGMVDALAQLRVEGTGTAPPAAPVEGGAYAVLPGAEDAWLGQDGRLALFLGGGWVFITPRAGWRGWDVAGGHPLRFDGAGWQDDTPPVPAAPTPAIRTELFEHVLSAGSTSDTAFVFDTQAMMFGVAVEVLEEVTGTLTSIAVGHNSDPYWFGWGLGVTQGASKILVPSWPARAGAARPVRFTAENGAFAAGRLAVRVDYYLPDLPGA